jgi:superfamily I DNA/RNA helicase
VARLLGGLNPDYERVLRPDDGVDPELHYYSSEANQRVLLVQVLEKLYREGFAGADIAVLSSKADASCLAASVSISPWKERLRPLDNAGKGHIEYCTIHAFKGMEKPAVIVTDIQRVATSVAESLFYVAVTRALDKLEVFVDESTKEEVVNALLNIPGNKR